MFLTTECVIADKPKEEAAHSHGAPDMGGMGNKKSRFNIFGTGFFI
jgi:hypothetical protein